MYRLEKWKRRIRLLHGKDEDIGQCVLLSDMDRMLEGFVVVMREEMKGFAGRLEKRLEKRD